MVDFNPIDMNQDKISEFNIKKLRKNDSFKVPDNYFEDFNYSMQIEISSNSPVVSVFERFIYMLRLRFTVPFLLVCFISLLTIQFDLSSKEDLMADAEIEQYLMNELQYAQLEDIVDLADFENPEILIRDSEILDYLESESIDNELIYQQLK